MEHAPDEFNKLDTSEQGISELENISIETSQVKSKENKDGKTEQSIQGLWDNYKKSNIHVINGHARRTGRRERNKRNT